jgi:hypothetical protein
MAFTIISKCFRKQVVYAITTTGRDLYTAMTRVSAASLRASNPDICIKIACDRTSEKAMQSVKEPLLREVDEVIVCDTPDGNPEFRNRFVKTKLRNNIDGPFLFLDSDIFVRGDIGNIFSLECDIAGARNHSRKTFAEQIWDQDRETLEAINWEVGQQVYLNGGVLFFNDTEGAYNFAEKWHQCWLQSYYELKKYRDQPALNHTLYITTPNVTILEDRYNAQVKTNTHVGKDAIIWHFYTSCIPGIFQFDLLVEHALKTNKISYKSIRSYQAQSAPWKTELLGDRFIGNRISKQGLAGGWEVEWLGLRRLKTPFLKPCCTVLEFLLRCFGKIGK